MTLEKGESFVLTPITGRNTTEITRTIGEEDAGYHGSYVCDYRSVN